MITYIKGDLFSVLDTGIPCHLAHCVSRDFNMGAGIAKEFRTRFSNVDYLQNQHKEIGKSAILPLSNTANIYYLITKERYYNKPTLADLTESIQDMYDNIKIGTIKYL